MFIANGSEYGKLTLPAVLIPTASVCTITLFAFNTVLFKYEKFCLLPFIFVGDRKSANHQQHPTALLWPGGHKEMSSILELK
jgi:hypothetical protein